MKTSDPGLLALWEIGDVCWFGDRGGCCFQGEDIGGFLLADDGDGDGGGGEAAGEGEVVGVCEGGAGEGCVFCIVLGVASVGGEGCGGLSGSGVCLWLLRGYLGVRWCRIVYRRVLRDSGGEEGQGEEGEGKKGVGVHVDDWRRLVE